MPRTARPRTGGGAARTGAAGAARRREGGQHGIGDCPAPAHRPPHLGHVLHGVGERAEAGAGCVRRQSPHGRADGDRRGDEGVVPEEAAQHVSAAAAAPAHQRAQAPSPARGQAAGECARGRHGVGQVDDQLRHRQRGPQVAPVPVHLVGIGERQRGQGPLPVVEQRPRRSAVVQEAELCRVHVQVAQAVGGEAQLVDDRCRPEEGVVAVADVHPGAEGRHGGGAPADLGPTLHQQGVDAGPGEVGGADQAVVAGADDDRTVVHGPFSSRPCAPSSRRSYR